ncbi:MAG: NTP transferase domain-containing protein, partial [Planctomycetota bacterium]
MKTLILCGGKGTRLNAHSEAIPKGLVEVGGKPILWHIMKIFEAQGYGEFVLCLGYRGSDIKEHFLIRAGSLQGDFTLDLAAPPPGRLLDLEGTREEGFKITFADTG